MREKEGNSAKEKSPKSILTHILPLPPPCSKHLNKISYSTHDDAYQMPALEIKCIPYTATNQKIYGSK
jgi:hypothetical protein